MSDLAHKLTKLNEAVRQLASAPSEAGLMDRVLDVVVRVFGRETAAVLLRDSAGDRLRIVASRGYQPEVVEAYHARVGEGVAGRVAESGEPLLVADVAAEPSYVAGVSQAISEMAVPLTVDGEVIGVLDLESRQQAFGDEDMALLRAFGEQVGWALRHGRAMAQAEERARRLALLNQAACALNGVHDPEQLLGRILELANEALGFDNVAVLVVEPDGRHLVVRKALRPDAQIEGIRVPVDRGVTGSVFRSGKAEVVADVTTDPRYLAGGVVGPHAEMVAPLKINGGITGVLDAESARSFDELDLEVFSAFAAQVATALRNAELMSDLSDRANRLAQITRSGRALNTILDVDDLLAEILDAVAEALSLERVAVLLFDRETKELEIHAARGYGDVLGKRIPLGQGVTGEVAVSGQAARIDDVSTEQRYLPGIDGGASEMAVPMQVHGELFGVLDTESPTPGAFSERDQELFTAFADLAGVALHNARLFRRLARANDRLKHNVTETERLNRELEAYAQQIKQANESLEQQIRQLTALHQAGQAITSSLDLNDTLQAILKMSGEIVASSVGAIKLIDSESKELRVAAQAGMLADNSSTLVRFDMPLRIGRRTIGVFELVRNVHGGLAEDEKKLLETLASQAAIAIENARLFENTQRIYYDTLKSLALALEARDDYTRGHSERVATLSLAVAHDLGLDEENCSLIHNSALLHDIGKIGIRDAVLLAPRKLTAEETAIIRQHPSYGNAILRPLQFLGGVAELVKHHHERWDGGGYPSGLSGEAIPLASRIIAVADCYDAMTSTRPYREARTHDTAIEELRREAGRQLDSEVVAAFMRVIERRLKQPSTG